MMQNGTKHRDTFSRHKHIDNISRHKHIDNIGISAGKVLGMMRKVKFLLSR